MKRVNQIFFQGLIIVLPISLTFYLLFWISVKAEGMFGSVIKMTLGQDLYIPGQGIILTILFILLVGMLAHNYVTARIFRWLTSQLERFPLIKAIYNPLKDLMALLPGRNQEGKEQRSVLVTVDGGVKLLGLLTRDGLDELPLGQDLVAVYVPYSYMLGGVTLLVTRDRIEKIDLPVDQAIKLSVTGWIKAREE